jgi:predicted glycoside hydrolase/deacetylase ChbG (UPF0249 family)
MLLRSGLSRRVDSGEVAGEALRQLARFEEEVGAPPDFIDGHQHVHALPGIRSGFLQAIRRRFPHGGPLIRNPGDSPIAIILRRSEVGKALALASLAMGFGRRVRRAGFPTNHGFSGVSAFDTSAPYETELASAFQHPGRRHLVMCHPGYPDAELATLDAVVVRRRDELDVMQEFAGLPELIWHVRERDVNGFPIWPGANIL